MKLLTLISVNASFMSPSMFNTDRVQFTGFRMQETLLKYASFAMHSVFLILKKYPLE